jgi:aerobic-type carbon monoxide dehydrogenase small subunit (CoxS/CutS family)
VTTIEGLAERHDFPALERAFAVHAALQCGYCTPGLLLTIQALLDEGALEDPEAIRRNLAGNLCRCTGYKAILEAVHELAGVPGP